MWLGITSNILQKENSKFKTIFGAIHFRSIFVSHGALEVSHNVRTFIENDKDLQTLICTSQCMYAKRLKMVWDGKYW
jgi:hypothetical protein